MKRTLTLISICIFTISIAFGSLFTVASILALLFGKANISDIEVVICIMNIPVFVYAWIAWMSKESVEKIKTYLTNGDSDQNRG